MTATAQHHWVPRGCNRTGRGGRRVPLGVSTFRQRRAGSFVPMYWPESISAGRSRCFAKVRPQSRRDRFQPASASDASRMTEYSPIAVQDWGGVPILARDFTENGCFSGAKRRWLIMDRAQRYRSPVQPHCFHGRGEDGKTNFRLSLARSGLIQFIERGMSLLTVSDRGLTLK